MLQAQSNNSSPSSITGDNNFATTTAYNTNEKSTVTFDDTSSNAVRKQLNRKLDICFVVWAFFGLFGMHLDRTNMRKYISSPNHHAYGPTNRTRHVISQRVCQWNERRLESPFSSI